VIAVALDLGVKTVDLSEFTGKSFSTRSSSSRSKSSSAIETPRLFSFLSDREGDVGLLHRVDR